VRNPAATAPQARNRSVSAYYELYGPLFRILSDGSGFMNLGWAEPGVRIRSVRDRQVRLIGRVAAAAGLKAVPRGDPETRSASDRADGPSVLDVGCGFLGPARALAGGFGCRVTGIDPGSAQRKDWKSAPPSPGVRPVAAVSERLPFRDGAFDRVICVESAFHYPDKPAFLREVRRVLGRGGRFVLADILAEPAGGIAGRLAGRFREALSSDGFWNADAYRAAAADAGLTQSGFTDLSGGVAGSCPLWSSVLFRRWRTLRRGYSSAALLKIALSLRLFPAAFRTLGFRYGLFVFEHPAGATAGDRGRP
jgi:sarcosine/dimethylglycine N-methyltransferase